MGDLDDPFGSLENPIDSIDQIDLINEQYDKANDGRGNKTANNFFHGSKKQLMNQIIEDNNIKKQRNYFRSIQNKSK